jgi:hypothetical protein
MAAQTAAVVSSGPTIPEMMKDRPRWWRDLNALLRSAALLYGDIYVDNTGEYPTCIAVARRVKQFYDFDLRTIRKAGEAMLKNRNFLPDVRGGQQTLLNNPLSHAFFAHVSNAVPLSKRRLFLKRYTATCCKCTRGRKKTKVYFRALM